MFDMTPYEKYIFILCMIVYVVLTLLFTTLIVYILRLSLKLIRGGVEDNKILDEYEKSRRRQNKGRLSEGIERIFTVLMCLVMFCAFGFAVYTQFTADNVTGKIPTYRVVLSDSMSKKNKNNKYLTENNLDDQFQRFDLILTRQLPAEEELKLYDIVVYEVEDALVIHRIVGIEEPNDKHAERYFRLQGDNVASADRELVKYSQMKAIYQGERIPHVGSFVAFLQSPAGYMCILLVVLSILLIPMMERKLEKTQRSRLLYIWAKEEEEERKKYTVCMHGKYLRDCPHCNEKYRR